MKDLEDLYTAFTAVALFGIIFMVLIQAISNNMHLNPLTPLVP